MIFLFIYIFYIKNIYNIYIIYSVNSDYYEQVSLKMVSNKSQVLAWMRDRPAFHHMVRASGQSEVWYDFTDEMKFRQYGWRCSTNEDSYSKSTLIGNWSEECFDTRRTVASRRPLPNQVGIIVILLLL